VKGRNFIEVDPYPDGELALDGQLCAAKDAVPGRVVAGVAGQKLTRGPQEAVG
jgi:hypothetical protein